MEFWPTLNATAPSGPLTLEDLERFFEVVKSQPPVVPCVHVINPTALYRPGWYTCASCGAPVEVTIPLSER